MLEAQAHLVVGGSSPVATTQISAASRRETSFAKAPSPAERPIQSPLRISGVRGNVE